jgi:formate/nitrite transporter FocA (FNT family)
MAILAGIMIALGATTYLSVGGLAGALLFAVGLMGVLAFEFKLFTGKAGLLADRNIGVLELAKIWGGNLLGCAITGCIVENTPVFEKIRDAATAITQTRIDNMWYENIFLGVLCGILMYVAVNGYKLTKNIAYAIVPVGAFILIGANHCVADMYYWIVGSTNIEMIGAGALALLCTTAGNIIGCNVIPAIKRIDYLSSSS